MLHKSLFILGRQPELGRAELESLFGAGAVELVGDHAAASSLPWEEIPFDRLGGSIRLAKPLAVFNTTDWHDIARKLTKELRSQVQGLPEGKVKLGLSVFGLDIRPQQLIATGLELKKVCRQAGRSARVVPNTTPELSSAQVLHNQLTGDLGIELLLVKSDRQVHLAQTKKIQDIEAYSRRDQQRPKRDARIGMLPPKLAQIIVNLATAQLEPKHGPVVLDPFCGTGVVLQEAALMGFDVYGSDIEPRMIEFTDKNLQWLKSLATNLTVHSPDGRYYTLEVGDATSHHWQHSISVVACETYLGRPLASWPDTETLQNIISTCNTVIKKFLVNITTQIPTGTRLCMAVPRWIAPNGQKYTLPLLDHLPEMGYNRVSFEHAGAPELVYYRPGQIVARELLVITRK